MSHVLSAWTSNRRSHRRARSATAIQAVVIFVIFDVLILSTTNQANLFVWMTAMVWVLFALATNVLFGWTGLLSFGQAAALGVGAYTDALLHNHHLSPLLLLLAGGLCAGAVAVGIAVVVLRTRGGQFAVLTLVFAQVLWLCTYRISALQGDNGFIGLGPTTVLGINVESTTHLFVYVTVVVLACALILLWLRNSSLGAYFLAIRDDPIRAAALGLPVRRLQVTSFGIAGSLGGVAGVLLAQQQQIVTPDVLLFTVSGQVIIACLIGGTGWFWGPAVGAVLIIWLNQLLFGVTNSANLYIGLLLLVVVLVVPGGLASVPRIAVQKWRLYRRSGGAEEPRRTNPPPVPVQPPVATTPTEAPVGRE